MSIPVQQLHVRRLRQDNHLLRRELSLHGCFHVDFCCECRDALVTGHLPIKVCQALHKPSACPFTVPGLSAQRHQVRLYATQTGVSVALEK